MKHKQKVTLDHFNGGEFIGWWDGKDWGGRQCNYDYKVSYLNRAAIHKRGVRREGRKHRVHNYACDFLKYLNHFDKARPSGYF